MSLFFFLFMCALEDSWDICSWPLTYFDDQSWRIDKVLLKYSLTALMLLIFPVIFVINLLFICLIIVLGTWLD